MVNQCANPQCSKPLHYLRDGRVYVFEVTAVAVTGEKLMRRMEHFWLCGACSELFFLEQSEDRSIRIAQRPLRPLSSTILPFRPPSSIAS